MWEEVFVERGRIERGENLMEKEKNYGINYGQSSFHFL